jgi:hypothetical protein
MIPLELFTWAREVCDVFTNFWYSDRQRSRTCLVSIRTGRYCPRSPPRRPCSEDEHKQGRPQRTGNCLQKTRADVDDQGHRTRLPVRQSSVHSCKTQCSLAQPSSGLLLNTIAGSMQATRSTSLASFLYCSLLSLHFPSFPIFSHILLHPAVHVTPDDIYHILVNTTLRFQQNSFSVNQTTKSYPF